MLCWTSFLLVYDVTKSAQIPVVGIKDDVHDVGYLVRGRECFVGLASY